MVSRTTQSKQFSRSFRNKGFTILELLIALAVGGLVLSMALALTLANRDLMSADEARTALNQNLRSGADIIGDDIRIAGERLRGSPPTLMPIVIRNNTITLRNNEEDTVMTLCQDLLRASDTKIYISREGSGTSTHSGCQSSPEKFQVWKDRRTGKENSNPRGSVPVYIHKPNTSGNPNNDDSQGEFFQYKDDGKDSSGFFIVRPSGGSGKEYTASTSPSANPKFQPKMYFLEERNYSLQNGDIELFINGSRKGVVIDNVSKFSIVAVMNDDTRQSTLDKPSDWLKLRAIEITLEGTVTVRGKPVTRKLVSQIFPRNVLSK